jgi:hypothetical protein
MSDKKIVAKTTKPSSGTSVTKPKKSSDAIKKTPVVKPPVKSSKQPTPVPQKRKSTPAATVVPKKKPKKAPSPPPEDDSEEEEEEEQPASDVESEGSEEEQSDAAADDVDGEGEEKEEEEQPPVAGRSDETAEVLFVQNIDGTGCLFEIDSINESCIKIISGPEAIVLGPGHTEHHTELVILPPIGYELHARETGHHMSHRGIILSPFTIVSAAMPTFLSLPLLNCSRSSITVEPYSTLAKLYVQKVQRAAFVQASPTDIQTAFVANKFVDTNDHANCLLAAARLF